MAEKRHIVKIINLILFFVFVAAINASGAYDYKVLFQDLPTNVLQRHIKVSRHQPFCVIFRTSGAGSKLEKLTYDLWQNKQDGNYTKWQFGSFSPDNMKMPPNNARPDKLPAVRCYLGETSAYQYMGKTRKPLLKDWFSKLSGLYAEQSAEVSLPTIQEAQLSHKILLLALPDGPRHHEVEDMIYGIADELDSCKAMAVHLGSPEVSSVRQVYGVNKYPSVVVINNKVVNKTLRETYQVFSGMDVNKHVLKIYIEAKSVVAPYLNMGSFEKLLYGNGKKSWRFKPTLVCFYAHWAKDIHGYLYAYNETVKQYREDFVNMRYGLVDLVRDQSKKVVGRYLKSGAMKFVPFLVLFYKDHTDALQHQVLHIGRPYSWTMYQPLIDLNIDIVAVTRVKQYSEPWGTVSQDQFSSLLEGPNGTWCTTWSHNMTDNTPYVKKIVRKRKSAIPKPVHKPVKDKTWHDLFDTGGLEKKLSVHSGIPLVTMETWTEVIEKSHAPRHIFYKAGKWAGEITKVSLVVFIMADCGNCRRNNKTFLDIQKAIAHVDGGSMYYVNCTAEPILCRNHNIRGFPTISAYRGLGWMDTSSCMTPINQKLFSRYVRMDYHGVIKPDPVLEWFSRSADNAVSSLMPDEQLTAFKDKDVRLVAQVMPASVLELPSVWSYKCLRLMCERLYSVVDCVIIQESSSSTASEDLQMAVVELVFERKDGVKVTIMEVNKALYDVLEHTDDSLIHRFHKPHNYNLTASQTCEDDVAVCTDVLTQFILDHSRLPLTSITSDIFHTSTSLLKEDDLPILIALAHTENLTESAQFSKDLVSVAYEVYNELTVMTLNVDKYSVWATKFVPHLYGHTRIFSDAANPDDPDPLSMYTYPRLCIVKKSDHSHAALYPPINRRRKKNEEFTREVMLEFVQSYLQEPKTWIIDTEHF